MLMLMLMPMLMPASPCARTHVHVLTRSPQAGTESSATQERRQAQEVAAASTLDGVCATVNLMVAQQVQLVTGADVQVGRERRRRGAGRLPLCRPTHTVCVRVGGGCTQ